MNLLTLKNDVNFLCGSTSATYADTDKLRNINVSYANVARIIWENAGGWQYDDSNATDFGIATTNIKASQQDYELPSTCQRLQAVELNNVRLKQVDLSDMPNSITNFEGQICYDIHGRSIFLYPTPSGDIAAGLKVFFDRDVTDLSADVDTPGFPVPFHRILSLSASLDFITEPNKRSFLVEQKISLEKGLAKFVSKRNLERQTAIRPKNKRSWRQYQ